MDDEKDAGELGERLVHQFFDSNLSKFYSFPHARNKQKAQVADLVVWLNRWLFLIEVKARDEGTSTLETWATWRIQQAVEQICRNHQRCEQKEEIFLYNDYFHVKLNHDGLSRHIGLVILAYDGVCNLSPTKAVPDIYERSLPIHVLSWQDLVSLRTEIDTGPDLFYYLQDRFEYVQNHDIPLGAEQEVIGYYKLHINSFPSEATDFGASAFWREYQEIMWDAIRQRELHNEYALFVDALEASFSDGRKLYDGLPVGLYFAWELGSLTRRARAYYGEKLSSVKQWFIDGKNTRQFAYQNPATANHHVFYFANSDERAIQERLLRLVELKLIKHVHIDDFQYAAYGFGFRVSKTLPIRMLGLASTIFVGSDEVRGYSQNDLDEAMRVWGKQKHTSITQVLEFPESELPQNPQGT